jgi:hypothetical protein
MYLLWFQVGWYSDSSGLHIDLEEDGTFQDYDGENEVGVTPPAFPLTEKPRSAPFVTTDQRPASRPKVALGGDRDRNNKQDFTAVETTTSNNKNLVSRPVFSYKAFISRTWALIVLTVAILGNIFFERK